MARINVEDAFWLEIISVAVAMGNQDQAIGQAIRFFRLAQEKHKAGELISEDEFKRQGFSESLIGSFAERVEGGIRCRGADKHFGWLKERVDAGRKGGSAKSEAKQKAAKEREDRKRLEAESERKQPQATTSKTPEPQPSPSPSYSLKELVVVHGTKAPAVSNSQDPIKLHEAIYSPERTRIQQGLEEIFRFLGRKSIPPQIRDNMNRISAYFENYTTFEENVAPIAETARSKTDPPRYLEASILKMIQKSEASYREWAGA